MTNRRNLLKAVAALSAAGRAEPQPRGETDRQFSVRLLTRLAEPVLTNLARGTLRRNMPVECAAGTEPDRRRYTHLEAFGRLMAGIAPWLEADLDAGDERQLQQRYRELAREAIRSGTDPRSPDFLNFSAGSQP